MTKIDVFSGFLGAGKTTLIKKLLAEAYAGEKVVLIENEFGQIGIDSGFLKQSGVQITEMNQGCICCSLVGDFGNALKQVLSDYAPDRILIEPSGVGKLSDVLRAVQGVTADGTAELNSATTVVDAGKCKLYMRNFGEFFNDQVESAQCIVLSHTDNADGDKLAAAVALLREHNTAATVVTTPWSALDGHRLLAAMEQRNTLEAALEEMAHEHHHHHHDGECDDPECCCHDHEHHHDHDEHECHGHGHHHHHGGECDDPDCHCHEHGHHHHHADDVFTSWGAETTKKYTVQGIRAALEALDETRFGTVLRAKGIVAAEDGSWIHFDYVPGEPDVRTGAADVTGRLCVIGAGLDQSAIAALFGLEA